MVFLLTTSVFARNTGRFSFLDSDLNNSHMKDNEGHQIHHISVEAPQRKEVLSLPRCV